MQKSNTIQWVVRQLTEGLKRVADRPEREAMLLLADALDKPNWHLRAYPESLVPDSVQKNLDEKLTLRQSGYPLAYILRKKGFWKHTFEVQEGVLIPRPETELLLEMALACLSKTPVGSPYPVVELGTGSGALILSLAAERPDLTYIAVDLSLEALSIAKRNAKAFPDCKLDFIQSDWFSNPVLAQCCPFSLILSNPPYIKANDLHLQDLQYEPLLALTPGKTGFEAFDKIISQAGHYLIPGGWLLLEHGYDQQTDLMHRLRVEGFQSIEGLLDLSGQPRVVKAKFRSFS